MRCTARRARGLMGAEPSESMPHWVGLAARHLRLGKNVKPVHIAAAADVDPSTIERFEAGRSRGFTYNLDAVVGAYASVLALENGPFAIWELALDMWRHGADDTAVATRLAMEHLEANVTGLVRDR